MKKLKHVTYYMRILNLGKPKGQICIDQKSGGPVLEMKCASTQVEKHCLRYRKKTRVTPCLFYGKFRIFYVTFLYLN